MKIKNYIFLFSLLPLVTNACWFQSRSTAANTIIAWAKTRGIDVDKGCRKSDLQHGIDRLPSGIAWVVKKAGGVEHIMKRCDLDHNGKITTDELLRESDCLNACWKQVAVTTFL